MTPKDRPHKGCNCDLSLDMDLASAVQQLLFPRSSPVCNWCCIGVENRMAQGLGGDYFDFIQMPDGCQTLYLGDVTGHGLHASVVMSLIYGFIHRASLERCDPLAVVRGVNQLLRSFANRSAELDHLFSTTLFFAIIDPKSLKMHYINCGHPTPMIRRDQELIALEGTAPPLGFFAAPEIEEASFDFLPDDRLLLYTDGISEAANPAGEMFGSARLATILQQSKGDHLEFLAEIYRELSEYGAITPPQDDCTAIVLDFHHPLPGATP